jgi:hypothetical protein
LSKVGLTWSLSAPNAGNALVPAGLDSNYIAEDGRRVFSKWDTILYAEEDGNLAWAGICTAANPSKDGTQLEFVGPMGWLQRVDYSAHYLVWKTNVFDVIRHIVKHAMTKPDSLDFTLPSTMSAFTVGDERPPTKPKEPARRRGETVSEWKNSARYKQYQKDLSAWNDEYGDREPFEIAWFEAPYVGEEIDTLAKENGFDYRERVEWRDKGQLISEFFIDLADNMVRRRDDIQFVDGMNIARPLDPKDGDERFANRVIALGGGDGRNMARVTRGGADGRLYQAEFVQYKSIKNITRLGQLAQADHKILNNKDPKIQTIAVWDVPGFADVSTLRVGDEVQVNSHNTATPIDAWVRVMRITRNPEENIVILTVETVA